MLTSSTSRCFKAWQVVPCCQYGSRDFPRNHKNIIFTLSSFFSCVCICDSKNNHSEKIFYLMMMINGKDSTDSCGYSTSSPTLDVSGDISRPCTGEPLSRYRQIELTSVTNNQLVTQHHYRFNSSPSIMGYQHGTGATGGDLGASSPSSPGSPTCNLGGIATTDCAFSRTSFASSTVKSRCDGGRGTSGGGINRKHNSPIPSVKLPEYPWVDDTPGARRFNEACEKNKKGKLFL